MKRVFNLAICLAFFCLFSGVNSASAQKNENYIIIDFYTTGLNVANMPESFRNIPIHEKDGSGMTGLIEQSSFHTSFYTRIGYRKIFVSDKTFKLGYDITALLPQSNFAERSYANSPGVQVDDYSKYMSFCGTSIAGPVGSLTGMKSILPGFSLIPGFVMETELGKNKALNPRLFLSTNYQALVAMNGWDRTNLKIVNEQKVLAHMLPTSLGFGFDFLDNSVTLNLGANLNLFLKTKSGQEFKASSTPINFFVNLNMRIVDYQY